MIQFGPFSPFLRIASEALRFGAVGITATVTHITSFVLWIEIVGMSPLWANLAAFCGAFIVSFVGHLGWTFRDQRTSEDASWRSAFAKFVFVALVGLTLNSLVVFLVVDVLSLSYVYAIVLMVAVVPACIFLLSKFWAFA